MFLNIATSSNMLSRNSALNNSSRDFQLLRILTIFPYV